MIVIMAGLPGTGKSTLARAVAAGVGGVVLDKDTFRASLFPPGHIEYSTEQDDFVVGLMLRVAGYLLQRDPGAVVFLDGRPFGRRYQVETVVGFAREIRTPWRIVECVCAEKLAMRRLRADLAARKHLATNRDVVLYREVKAGFQEIRRRKLVVRTTLKPESCVRRVEKYLSGE